MKFVATTSYTLLMMLYTVNEYPNVQTWADYKFGVSHIFSDEVAQRQDLG